MPEGLSPIEAGKKAARARPGAAPHRRGPPTPTGIRARCRSVRRCCCRWSRSRPPGPGMPRPTGAPSAPFALAQAATLRNLATRADLAALSTRNFDSFNLQRLVHRVHPRRSEEAAIAERRFRPEYKVAFDAWIATDPFDNPKLLQDPATCPSTSWPTRPRPRRETGRPSRRRRRECGGGG